MSSLKTMEAYLLSLAGYGAYVNVLTLHNLLNVHKLSICSTVPLVWNPLEFREETYPAKTRGMEVPTVYRKFHNPNFNCF